MRIKFLIGLTITLLILGGIATAQTDYSIDMVDGLWGPDSLNINEIITFHIRMINNSDGNITGNTNGFRVYSPTGAEWNTTTGAFTGAITTSMYDAPLQINTFSITGSGADTVGFGGFKMFAPGIPTDFDAVAWTISIGPIDPMYHGDDICVDTTYYPPAGVWKWSTTAGDYFPNWDGPHCYKIFDPEAPPENQPPVVTDIPGQTVLEGGSFTPLDLNPYVTDPDNSDAEMTWSTTGDVELIVNITNGIATIDKPSPGWTGTETITFRATDPGALFDEDAAVFEVTALNDPPVITDIPGQSVPEGTPFDQIFLDDYVTDPDNTDEEISWMVTGQVELTVTIVDRVATIEAPTPDWNGDEIVTFRATDPGELFAEDMATFEVTPENDAPVVTDIPGESVTEGVPFATINLNDYVSDVDNDDIEMTWVTTGDVNLDITIVDGIATITPLDPEWNDIEVVTFRAYDPGGLYDEDMATFEITPVNDPPIISDIPNQILPEHSTFTQVNLDDYVSDADNDDNELMWSSSGAIQLTVDIVDRVATITMPSPDWIGSEIISFHVEDPLGLFDDDDATFAITEQNDPPVMTDIPGQEVPEGTPFDPVNLNTYVTDPDNSDAEMTWTTSGNSALNVTIIDGIATIEPIDPNWNGSETVTFRATDPGALFAEDDALFTITPENDPPVVSGIPGQSVPEGTPFADVNLDLYVTDPDNTPEEMTWTSSGATALIVTIVDRVATITVPTEDWNGSELITFRAEDPDGLYGEASATFEVTPINDAPTIPVIQDFNITECDTIDVILVAQDVDGDDLDLWLEPLADNMSFMDNDDGTGDFYFAPSYAQAGSYPLTMYASDGIETVSIGFTVNVTDCQVGSEGDTLFIDMPAIVPGSHITVAVDIANICPLNGMNAIIGWESAYLFLDSVSFVGSRMDYMSSKNVVIDNIDQTLTMEIMATGGESNLPDGKGLLCNLFYSIDNGTPDDAYAINPFLIQTVDLNPQFFRDCGGGVEMVAPFIVPGGISIQTTENYVCGYVVDPDQNVIPGATVELWADFPASGMELQTFTNSFGAFAFDGFTTNPFDLYAYKDGYYPDTVANLEYGDEGIMMVLTPIEEEVYPTNEWVSFYCGDNTFKDAPLPIGSVVEARDADSTLCGYWNVTVEGYYGYMPVYRDDPFMDGDQGASPGDIIRFFVNGTEALVTGDPTWTEHGDTSLVCLNVSAQIPYTCYLSTGWNLVSWPVDTDFDDIEIVFASLDGCVELVLGFEQGGLTYAPTMPEFSTLHEVDHLSGYWIKIDPTCQDATLDMMGAVIPVTTPVWLDLGWNLVSYLPDEAQATPDALASIHDYLIVAQGYDPSLPDPKMTYVPGMTVQNTLDEMTSCFGYWVKVTQEMDLVYSNTVVPAPAKETVTQIASNDRIGFETTRWVNVYSHKLTLDGVSVGTGADITAHNQSGETVGSFTIGDDGRFGFMPVYADDPTNQSSVLSPGESFYLAVDGQMTQEAIIWTQLGAFIEVGELTSKSEPDELLPNEYSLQQNYPNPFNPATTIKFSMKTSGKAHLQVFNILGELVAVPFDGVADAGYNEVVWDGKDQSGNTVASGVYFYRLVADNYSETRKMMLLK